MEKLYIGIYGSVNSGKSSLINKLAGQMTAIVSPERGTTTDPVKKLLELEGIGPAVLIDSAGIDDTTPLGALRIAKTMQTLDIIDMAIVVIAHGNITKEDFGLISIFQEKKIPFFILNNKSDEPGFKDVSTAGIETLSYSCSTATDVLPVLALIKKLKPEYLAEKQILLADIINAGDIVVLVMPIDSAAPKGRLILPQVNTIRDILDNHAVSIVLQESELSDFLKLPIKIRLVVTDSQAFKNVSAIVPKEIPLTSFSILFARLKGNFDEYLNGADAISKLKDGDKVLILESCSHTANTCDDIGRVKLPKLISAKTGKKLEFKIVANLDPLPEDTSTYALVVQCGGCMVTKKQLLNRIGVPLAEGVPVTNYGIAIAFCTGILPRVTQVFQ